MEVSNLTKKRIIGYMKEGKRFDSRGLLEYRDIKIELGVSKNAEGSARIKIGNTDVIAGIKLEKDDEVVSLEVLRSQAILTITKTIL